MTGPQSVQLFRVADLLFWSLISANSSVACFLVQSNANGVIAFTFNREMENIDDLGQEIKGGDAATKSKHNGQMCWIFQHPEICNSVPMCKRTTPVLENRVVHMFASFLYFSFTYVFELWSIPNWILRGCVWPSGPAVLTSPLITSFV